jgi:predicted acylesterase/phospholipase RssA
VIAATNWEMGIVRFFENHDMTDQLGPLAILSSTAIPGVFQPVACGAQVYVDGGVLLNTPLEPAIDRGANVLHVISLFPSVDKIPLGTIDSTLSTVYRQQLIGWTKSLESSVRRVRDINRVLRISGFASTILQWVRERASAEECANLHVEDIELHLKRYERYTPVTVHQYFPGDDVSGALGLLDFDRDRIKGLIERGFEDAVQHDCEKNQCVLFEVDPSAERMAAPEASQFNM